MKNNFLVFLLYCLISLNVSMADQFNFETSEIQLIDNGNIINAKDGKALSSDGNLEIQAEEFKYKKNENMLEAFNGVAFFKDENLEIEFNEILFDQKNLITTAKNNVKILNLKKKVSIETSDLIYDKKNNYLESQNSSKINDEFRNTLEVSYFLYNFNNGVLKFKNVHLKDSDNNNFFIDVAYLNTITNELIGNDILVNLDNKSFNKDNDPRIKGKSIIYQNKIAEINKGVFTTCKKTDKCPPWQIFAEQVKHNPDNQTINYKNAFLKVYNVPVMYFPKFFHPDPTVKRKSGFLIPTIKNSSEGTSYFSIPYYSVISQNKDFTFTPRIYSNSNFLLQSEFRQENENSSHIADISFFNQKQANSKTHFFYRYNKLMNFIKFEDSNLKLNIEKTSNDTYLRQNKLSSPIIKNYNVLESYLGVDLFSSDLSIQSEVKVYESLDIENSHDRYEFILPKLDIVKRLKNRTNLDGNFFIKSNNFIRSYATNILEKVNVNNFIFNSNPKKTRKGFNNNYDLLIRNANSSAQNSSSYEEDEDMYISGMFQFNSSLPLIKENNSFSKILKPKMAFKISPNNTKDVRNSDGNRIDVNNIFSLERLSSDNSLEGGTSLIIGNDFSIIDKENSKEIFEIKLANNLRLEENDDLPGNNQLGSKTSNFFGEISYNPNDILKTKYNASTKNNLTDINYENLNVELSLNNFVTSFDYLNENSSKNKNSYLTNTTQYNFNDSNSIKFATRENKTTNLTEYYDLIYEYKNDCLAASVEYNKNYYDDRDIKPEENIFLKLTIIPFGETSSPNLRE